MLKLLLFFSLCLPALATTGSTTAVFTVLEKNLGGLNGQALLPWPASANTLAFLIRTNGPLASMTKGLIAPHYQTPINKNAYAFQFVAPGNYILGSYWDQDKNGLLSWGAEPVVIYTGSPVSYPTTQILKIESNPESSLELFLRGFPKNDRLGLKVLTPSMTPLFSLSVPEGNQKIILPFLPAECILQFSEDEDSDGSLNLDLEPAYSFLRSSVKTRTIEYQKPWNPLSFQLQNAPADLRIRLESKNPPYQINLSSQTRIDHLTPSEAMQITFLTSRAASLSLSSIEHLQAKTLEFEFLTQPKLRFSTPPDSNCIEVRMSGSETRQHPPKIEDFNPLLASDYEIFLYTSSPCSPLSSAFIYTHVNRIDKSLDNENQTQEIRPPRPQMDHFQGVYRIFRSIPGASLILYQQTDTPEIYNLLQSVPTSLAGSSDHIPLEFDFPFGHKFLAFIDFNQNQKLDRQELPFRREFDPVNLAQSNAYLEMPLIKEGTLNLKALNPPTGKGRYYAEIFYPGQPESLASAFFEENTLSFSALPLEIPLKIQWMEDKNDNQELDSTDQQFEPVTVIIPHKSRQIEIELP